MYEVIFFITLAFCGALLCCCGLNDSNPKSDKANVIFTEEDERKLEKELEQEIIEDDKNLREQRLAKIRKRLKPKL